MVDLKVCFWRTFIISTSFFLLGTNYSYNQNVAIRFVKKYVSGVSVSNGTNGPKDLLFSSPLSTDDQPLQCPQSRFHPRLIYLLRTHNYTFGEDYIWISKTTHEHPTTPKLRNISLDQATLMLCIIMMFPSRDSSSHSLVHYTISHS